MDLLFFLEYGSILVAACAAIFAALTFRNLRKVLRPLSAFLVLTILLQIIAVYLNLKYTNNLFLFHLYTPIEFTVFCLTLSFSEKKATRQKLIFIAAIVFFIFCIVSAIAIENVKEFNSIPRGVEGVIAIALCVYFFYQLFMSEESFDLLKYPFFWLFGGWFIYFSGTFFLFIYANHAGTNLTYPIIHSILNIFLNLVYTYVLWLGSRKSIS